MMIEPVRKTVYAACPPAEAFDIFVDRIDRWWPKDKYSISASRGSGTAAKIVFECQSGGRIYEVCDDGSIEQWGLVSVADRGRKLVFSWHVGHPADRASEIEIGFTDAGEKGTRVEMEHRNWEAFGDGAQAIRERYNGGWDFVIGDCYVSATVLEARETA